MRNHMTVLFYANLLARNDLSLRYASSLLGPFWITGQMLIFVLGLGFVFSGVFNTPMRDFLPYLAISMTFWTFFSACVTESAMAILDGSAFIKDRGVRPQTFVIKVYIRNLYILSHNILVPLLIFVAFDKFLIVNLVSALPGFVLFIVISGLLMTPVAMVTARFRDFKPILESITQLGFLITPIMWQPDAVAGRDYIVDYNPLAVLFSLWREPLLTGQMSDARNWIFALCIFLAVLLLNRLAARSYRKCMFWI